MACSIKTSSLSLVILTLQFVCFIQILGLACFALGVYLKFWAQPTDGELASFNTLVYMLIFVGFFTILVSILGCISAAVENICLLTLVRKQKFHMEIIFNLYCEIIRAGNNKQCRLSSCSQPTYVLDNSMSITK